MFACSSCYSIRYLLWRMQLRTPCFKYQNFFQYVELFSQLVEFFNLAIVTYGPFFNRVSPTPNTLRLHENRLLTKSTLASWIGLCSSLALGRIGYWCTICMHLSKFNHMFQVWFLFMRAMGHVIFNLPNFNSAIPEFHHTDKD